MTRACAKFASRVKGVLSGRAAGGAVPTIRSALSLLLATAAAFLVVLGFVVRNEDLKFAGAIGLLSVMVIVLTRRLAGARRKDQ